jgi:hypothetical protein
MNISVGMTIAIAKDLLLRIPSLPSSLIKAD